MILTFVTENDALSRGFPELFRRYMKGYGISPNEDKEYWVRTLGRHSRQPIAFYLDLKHFGMGNVHQIAISSNDESGKQEDVEFLSEQMIHLFKESVLSQIRKRRKSFEPREFGWEDNHFVYL